MGFYDDVILFFITKLNLFVYLCVEFCGCFRLGVELKVHSVVVSD